MNAGFTEMLKIYDFNCVVFHDVDMIPEDDRNFYLCGKAPIHLSPKIDKYDYIYPYGTQFGGVTMISKKMYQFVNGYTNLFWGWGKEDTDMQYRISSKNITINLPTNIEFGKYTMLRHTHTSSFQNERMTEGAEDDRTTSLKRALMGVRTERVEKDGLNSVEGEYRVVKTEKTQLFIKMVFDLRRMELEQFSLKQKFTKIVDEHLPSEILLKSHRDLINYEFNKKQTCETIRLPYTIVRDSYFLPGGEPIENPRALEDWAGVVNCPPPCIGLSRDVRLMPRPNYQKKVSFLPIIIPLLEHVPEHDVRTRHSGSGNHHLWTGNYTYSTNTLRTFIHYCNNSLDSWQVVKNPIIFDKTGNKLSLGFKFEGKKFARDLSRLIYRDSWVFEARRIMSHNVFLNGIRNGNWQEEIVHDVAEDENSIELKTKPARIEYKEVSDEDKNVTFVLNVDFSLQNLASGYYNVFSKIVDSFGQPYTEMNFMFTVENGILDKRDFIAHFKRSNDYIVPDDLIGSFKKEMKMEFKKVSTS